jgi:predicted O-linked N-acetylglucosamine transferase (SPINDLY family)
MAQLPTISRTEAEADAARQAYGEQLALLRTQTDNGLPTAELAAAAGTLHPFLLAYQGRNDRALQAEYGSIMCRAMAAHHRPPPLPLPPRNDEKVRLGIVSAFFCAHSNWKLPIRGWLGQLDRNRFQLFAYHTGSKWDAYTDTAAALCDRLVRGRRDVAAWRDAICADAPHVLIYPEIGMNDRTIQLAMQRLAPVQCSSWGHPETSGFPTIDYFLSSDLMEPPDADAYYTERLIRLPGLSIYYEPLDMQPESLSRAEIGLRPGSVAYWCGQNLCKYLPQLDHVFPAIAQAVGDCQFVFVGFPPIDHVVRVFRERMEAAFAAAGLDMLHHCVFLPLLSSGRFVGALAQCDVVLDSIGWSGSNTTLEGLPSKRPVVTLERGPMRARHTAAILRMMGITQTIAGSVEEYVGIAARLAADAEWRATLSRLMGERTELVYRDRTCIDALENFLDAAARAGQAASAGKPG